MLAFEVQELALSTTNFMSTGVIKKKKRLFIYRYSCTKTWQHPKSTAAPCSSDGTNEFVELIGGSEGVLYDDLI